MTVQGGDPTITLALIGIVSTVIVALFKLLNANTKALGKLVTSNDKVAKATTKGANEAKQRNGHLAELIIESKKDTLQAVQNISKQHVETQTVDKVIHKGGK